MEDSRLKGYFGNVTHVTQGMERTYCILCGKEFGGTTMDTSTTIRPVQVIVVCDPCHDACGGKPIPGMDLLGWAPEKKSEIAK